MKEVYTSCQIGRRPYFQGSTLPLQIVERSINGSGSLMKSACWLPARNGLIFRRRPKLFCCGWRRIRRWSPCRKAANCTSRSAPQRNSNVASRTAAASRRAHRSVPWGDRRRIAVGTRTHLCPSAASYHHRHCGNNRGSAFSGTQQTDESKRAGCLRRGGSIAERAGPPCEVNGELSCH